MTRMTLVTHEYVDDAGFYSLAAYLRTLDPECLLTCSRLSQVDPDALLEFMGNVDSLSFACAARVCLTLVDLQAAGRMCITERSSRR